MDKNLRWLVKEVKKDKSEVAYHKNNIINNILKASKEEITKGPIKISKDSLWKRIWKKVKGL